ncbi:hypothetical protein ACJQWK_02842 [Exserohilum turcicum]
MASQTTPAHPTTTMQEQSETPPRPPPILTTKRLIIRPMYLPDAASTAQHANDPLVARYMSLAFPNPYTLDSATAWITMNLALARQEAFVICTISAPDVVIGGIGLKPGRDVTEVGFWVARMYWGNGFMSEALAGFTHWAFENWVGDRGCGLRRLWGGAFAPNAASVRCFEKCGYVHEGVMKGHCEKNGEVMDMHYLGLTKTDWEERVRGVGET